MIKGIGCDIVQLSRVKPELAKRILTEAELAVWMELKTSERQTEFLAGRFAAKEAIQKALTSLGLTPGLRDIVLLPGPSGEPLVIKPEVTGHRIFVSIAHERSHAIATCVVETI